MNITFRQHVLLLTAITLFYDEVAKTSTPEMKRELMELGEIIQAAALKAK